MTKENKSRDKIILDDDSLEQSKEIKNEKEIKELGEKDKNKKKKKKK